MEYLEKTEIAGNTITTKQENNMENQTQHTINVTVPVSEVIKLAVPANEIIKEMTKNSEFVNFLFDNENAVYKLQEVLREKIEEKVESCVAETTENSVEEYFSENGSELLDRYNVMTSDNIDEHIGSYLSDNLDDYINQSDIVDEVVSSLDDRDFVTDAIENNLNQYSPKSTCGISKKAYEAIIDSVRYDLMCHGINESTRESHYIHGDGLTIFNQLKRIIEEIVDNKLHKVELVKTFDNSTKYEIVEDVVPSTAFPCTHFKITTYTPEQTEAIKAFLFSNQEMQKSRIAFTTKTNTEHNPL